MGIEMASNAASERQITISGDYESFISSLTEGVAILIEATERTAPVILDKMSEWIANVPIRELCFSGNLASEFEDAADSVLEEICRLGVPTSAFDSEADACEHFLFAAGYAGLPLLVFAEANGELEAMLKVICADEERGGGIIPPINRAG